MPDLARGLAGMRGTPAQRLRAIKTVHTAIWFSIEASVFYLLYAGIVGKRGRSVRIATALVVGESLIYLGNGARCPLTSVAKAHGAASGSVTDIYLPRWLAKSLPLIHVPLLGMIVWLHTRDRR